MVLIYVLSGTLDFATNAHAGILPADVHNGVIIVLYVCCILGFAKNAVMPLHHWLPGAMVAPTPVSALLHAVAVVKVGVFSTVRVMLYVFGVDLMDRLHLGLPTAYFVSITILVGSIVALSKDDLKARLAYSTVSQLSYIILGVALLTPTAVAGGLFHIAAHAFAKITLFFCAGAIYVATRKKNISEMSGLGRAMPWTFGAFGLAALSMIGAPPVGGFISKLYLVVGALDAGPLDAPRPASSPCSSPVRSSMRPISRRSSTTPSSAHRPPGMTGSRSGEAPLAMLIPLCLTAAISVAIGLFPDLFMNFAQAVLP